jgi:Asp/Glu/hydantoin racemase
MRIWWQSSRSFKEGPGAEKGKAELLSYLNLLKANDVEITIGSADQSSVHVRYDTVGVLQYAAPGGMLNKIIRAEGQGYDGAVIGCYHDLGLQEAKEMCTFPVYGVLETSAHLACMLGDRFSGVTTGDKQARLCDRKMREYGVRDKAIPFAYVKSTLQERMQSLDHPTSPLIEKFIEAARKLASDGAEVIIPACGWLDLILAKKGIREIDGAVVLRGYAAVLKCAEAMIRLYQEIGLGKSRKLLYATPSKEQVDEILSTYMFR